MARARALISLGLLLAVVGCGSSSSKSTSTSSSSSPTQYVAKANALCRQASAKTPKFPGLKQGKGYVTTASRIIPYLVKVQAITSARLVSFERLAPAGAQRAKAAQLLAAERARLDDLNSALAAARAGKGSAFTTAIQKDQRQDRPRYVRAAVALHLNACAAGA